MKESDADRLSEWTSAGIAPDAAAAFIRSNVTLETAKEWLAQTDYSAEDVLDFLEKDVSLVEAVDFDRRGIQPHQVTRAGSRLELDLDPWQVDPADQLPSEITPGQFTITLWTTALGGEPVAHDVSFTWDGSQIAEWDEDISWQNDGLSVMSSSPVSGVLAWPNGKDVLLTFRWADLGLEGHDRFSNFAPASSGNASDPDDWLRLADALIDFVLLDLGSGSHSEESFTYIDTATNVDLDLDEMLKRYVASGEAATQSDFGAWLDSMTESGRYQLVEDDEDE